VIVIKIKMSSGFPCQSRTNDFENINKNIIIYEKYSNVKIVEQSYYKEKKLIK
jgi:hypothetical protein